MWHLSCELTTFTKKNEQWMNNLDGSFIEMFLKRKKNNLKSY